MLSFFSGVRLGNPVDCSPPRASPSALDYTAHHPEHSVSPLRARTQNSPRVSYQTGDPHSGARVSFLRPQTPQGQRLPLHQTPSALEDNEGLL